MNKVELAKIIAKSLHCGQKYDDHDYYYHVEKVYQALVEFGITDENLLVAGLLHDVVEDTQMKLSLIEEFFGPIVKALVYAVTNEIGANRNERNIKTYPKLMGNPEAITVKLADRIANVRQCIAKNNTGMLEVYREEYKTFKKFLYTPNTQNLMWNELDKLLT